MDTHRPKSAALTFFLWLVSLLIVDGENVLAPLVFRPSGLWEGNDGPWATFAIRVGTPSQTVRLLPATSMSGILVVLPQGCDAGNVSNCYNSTRGGFFNEESSSTWSPIGRYVLGDTQTQNLGYTRSGLYGTDVVGLDSDSIGGPRMVNQSVAGINITDFDLGLFGMSPDGLNFSSFEDGIPSFFQSLQSSARIDTRVWSFTQGVFSESGQSVPPSLIFGGYDEARFDNSSTVTIAMDPDVSKPLSVHVSGMSYSAGANSGALGLSLQNPITAVIDSSISHIWLPIDVCKAFETSFGLEWDLNSELYLINETLYTTLLSKNITIAIDIGSPSSATPQQTTIKYSFASLILNASTPLTSPPSRYFALKKAVNPSQYTLGRAFLQQAYVTANYDKQTFDLSRAVYTGDSRIFAISAETNTTTPGNVTSINKGKGSISSGAIVGIVIASIFAMVALYTFPAWIMASFRKTPQLPISTYPDDFMKAEMDGQGKPMMEVDSRDMKVFEVAANHVSRELEGPDRVPMELWGEQVREIEGPDRPPIEMLGVVPRYELPAND